MTNEITLRWQKDGYTCSTTAVANVVPSKCEACLLRRGVGTSQLSGPGSKQKSSNNRRTRSVVKPVSRNNTNVSKWMTPLRLIDASAFDETAMAFRRTGVE
uniref:DUF4379 domain-containing protein n=1 Tax=Panagrellus redivivus TaxID=6233 RepID=A0A7E4V4B2_PANRE